MKDQKTVRELLNEWNNAMNEGEEADSIYNRVKEIDSQIKKLASERNKLRGEYKSVYASALKETYQELSDAVKKAFPGEKVGWSNKEKAVVVSFGSVSNAPSKFGGGFGAVKQKIENIFGTGTINITAGGGSMGRGGESKSVYISFTKKYVASLGTIKPLPNPPSGISLFDVD